MTRLDTELNVYKARYQWTNERLCDVLGIKDTAFRSKRKGKVPFTAKELVKLAQVLGMSIEETYELLPEINH